MRQNPQCAKQKGCIGQDHASHSEGDDLGCPREPDRMHQPPRQQGQPDRMQRNARRALQFSDQQQDKPNARLFHTVALRSNPFEQGLVVGITNRDHVGAPVLNDPDAKRDHQQRQQRSIKGR